MWRFEVFPSPDLAVGPDWQPLLAEGCLDALARANEAAEHEPAVLFDQVAEVLAHDCAVATAAALQLPDDAAEPLHQPDASEPPQTDAAIAAAEELQQRRALVAGVLQQQPQQQQQQDGEAPPPPSPSPRLRVGPEYAQHRNIITRVLDDALLASIANMPTDERQVVLLGHGLDSRAYRIAWPEGTRIFEVGPAQCLQLMKEVLRGNGGETTFRQRGVVHRRIALNPWKHTGAGPLVLRMHARIACGCNKAGALRAPAAVGLVTAAVVAVVVGAACSHTQARSAPALPQRRTQLWAQERWEHPARTCAGKRRA